jgi:phosphoserine phosphatase
MSEDHGSAAFFRLETALTKEPAWRHARALAVQAPSMRARALALGVTTLGGALGLSPVLGGATAAARTGWKQVEGFSRDRVEVLGADIAMDQLLPKVPAHARRLLDEARARGRTLVLVADTIRAIAQPFARALDIEVVVASDLVWSTKDEATGDVEPAVLGPKELRALAERHGLSLERSAAYGGVAADAILLSHVGSPCAIDPDAELARIARELDWPVVRGPATKETA